MKIVFWWNIPCAGMIGVLKSYCEDIDNSAIVVTGALSKSRKSMGWNDKGKLFKSHIILNDDEWEHKGPEILDQYKDRLHVFNGITHPARMMRVINFAIKRNIKFCNMSEAYSNLSYGLRGLVKDLYIKYYLPLLVRPIAQYSQGILCLSGASSKYLKQFKSLGFSRKAIYPYGYYTDEDISYYYKPAPDGKIHILCPGLLERYKGVDLLIKALHIVTNLQGVKNYICHITGNGHQRRFLESLVVKYGLKDHIIFEGVLDSDKYNELLSHIDVLIAPGRVEPWGIRINEAIQRGNAVIVSSGLGAAELINASRGGAVFRSGDIKDLASKIDNLLINRDRLLCAKQNNVKYKQNISCKYQAEVLAKILDQIIINH